MEKLGTPIGSYAPDFELPGIDNKVHHLANYLQAFQAVGVVIMANQCPFVQAYLDRLKQLQTDFQSQGFTLIGINANDAAQYPEESFENMKAFAAEQQLNFPYLRDVTQDVARSFGAERTPEAFLVDQSGILRYSGAIDNNAREPAAVQTSYFRNAIAQMLRGETITLTSTKSEGCAVKWRR